MHEVLPPHREEGRPPGPGPVLHGGMGTATDNQKGRPGGNPAGVVPAEKTERQGETMTGTEIKQQAKELAKACEKAGVTYTIVLDNVEGSTIIDTNADEDTICAVMVATLMEAAHGDLTGARLLIGTLQAAAYDGRIAELIKSRYAPGQRVN